jgi:outer membrane lipoprotein-sorting protein
MCRKGTHPPLWLGQSLLSIVAIKLAVETGRVNSTNVPVRHNFSLLASLQVRLGLRQVFRHHAALTPIWRGCYPSCFACMRSLRLRSHRPNLIAVLIVLVLSSACAVSQKHTVPPSQVRPALTATKDTLINQYNQEANGVHSLNASIDMFPTAGSTYSGVIEQYHDVTGFILAQRPADIRMIGQVPVVATNIFDMVSDGTTFRIFIPSQNKFIIGPADLDRPAAKPIENLRPQHLLDALFWPTITDETPVLFEEWNEPPERYYLLTVLRASAASSGRRSFEIQRRVWFDRADLSIVRLEAYGPGGKLDSDVRYANWQPAGDLKYPRIIRIVRPHEDYQLEIHILKLELNETISADRFQLPQPPGSELVRVAGVGEAANR